MANNTPTPPDDFYLRNRETLLQYEDARLNSLLQAMANFYTTRNDQSTWGNFLRALAIELSKLEYDYSYDIVGKNPSYLTPPDISRRWRDPLYVSSNWPSPTQFDTAFKLMLVELIAAYRMGSTVAGIQAVIFAYTGINIVVQELYKDIGDGVYDISDTNSIRVSVSVGNNTLSQITSLTQLQQIVQSLYGAIDLAKPAHVGLEFTTVFNEGEDIDCFISPAFLTAQQYGTVTQEEQSAYSLTNYVLINPPIFWLASTSLSNPYSLNTLLKDSNGNLQLVVVSGKPGTTQPIWDQTSAEFTIDGGIVWQNISPAIISLYLASNVVTVTMAANGFNQTFLVGQRVTLVNLSSSEDFSFLNGVPLSVLTSTETTFTAAYNNGGVTVSFTPQTQGTVAYIPPASINIIAYKDLAYEVLITATSVTSNILTVVADNNFVVDQTVTLQGTGEAFLNGQTVTITSAFSTYFIADFETANYSNDEDMGTAFSSALQSLYQPQYTNTNCSSTGIQDTLRIFVQLVEPPPQNPMLIQAPVLNPPNLPMPPGSQQTLPNPMTTVTAWGSTMSPTLTQAQWAALPTITFDVVNTVANGITAGYTFDNLVGGLTVAPPNLDLHEGMRVTIIGCRSEFNITGRIQDVVLITPTSGTFQISLLETVASAAETGTGTVTPTLQSAYSVQGGQYVLLVDSSLPPLSDPTLNTPSRWIQVSGVDRATNTPLNAPSGEVANWDAAHPAGLVAPRLSQVWEIQSDQDFIFELP